MKIIKISNCDICNRYAGLYKYTNELICDTCWGKLSKFRGMGEENVKSLRKDIEDGKETRSQISQS